MSNSSKYELFMDEIVSLEKKVHKFVVDNQKVIEEKDILEKKVVKLEKENEVLILKIKELEKKLGKVEETSASLAEKSNLDLTERENLKSQIDDLIARIDYHIRS